MAESKVCTKCGEAKPLDAFGVRKRPTGDYPRSACKQCESNSFKDYRSRNPEKARAATKRWERNNPDKVKAKQRRRQTSGKQAESDKRWALKNPDKVKARSAAWVARGGAAEAQRQYRERQGQAYLEYQREWARAGKGAEKIARRRAREANNPTYTILPRELDRLLASPCIECGATEQITIDHLIPIARGGSHGIGNLAPMCGSCNSSKRDRTLTEWRVLKMRRAA